METMISMNQPRDSSITKTINWQIKVKVPRWLAAFVEENRQTLPFLGIVIGAAILTLCLQAPSQAQLFQDVEADADKISSFLPALGDGVEFFGEVARMLIFGGGIIGIIGAAFNFITNRGWEVWIAITATILFLGGLAYGIETIVYGS